MVANLDEQVTLSVTTDSLFPQIQWQWRKNSAAISGATSAQYTIAKTASTDAGSYDVVLTNYLGSVTSNPATLTVNPAAPATIASQPENQTGNVGSNVTLAFTMSGNPVPKVQWYKNGTAITGATATSLSITNVTKTDAATYTATIKNTYNGAEYSLTTAPAVLTVIAPPIFAVQPANQVVLAGAQVTFTAAVQGLATTTYQWQKNGSPISGATGSSYLIPAAATTDAGAYSVVATNNEGSTTSDVAQLVVNVAIPPTIAVAPTNNTIVANDRAELSVVASGTSPLTYQWYQGESGTITTPIPGATSPTFFTPALSTTTSYWVRITDANGSVTNSPAATVTVAGSSNLSVSHVVLGGGYLSGGVVAVTNTITYTGTAPSAISWSTLLPQGWKYLGSGGADSMIARPQYKADNLIEWTWSSVPPSPIEFTYTVGVPAGTTGDQQIISIVEATQAGTNIQAMAKPDPLVIRSASMHSADTNRDAKIDLAELTRVIQLYNHRVGAERTGQYHQQTGTVDGFAPGP